jgi:hypothetical protein
MRSNQRPPGNLWLGGGRFCRFHLFTTAHFQSGKDTTQWNLDRALRHSPSVYAFSIRKGYNPMELSTYPATELLVKWRLAEVERSLNPLEEIATHKL